MNFLYINDYKKSYYFHASFFQETINILVKFPFAADTASKQRMFFVSQLSHTYAIHTQFMLNNFFFKQKFTQNENSVIISSSFFEDLLLAFLPLLQ